MSSIVDCKDYEACIVCDDLYVSLEEGTEDYCSRCAMQKVEELADQAIDIFREFECFGFGNMPGAAPGSDAAIGLAAQCLAGELLSSVVSIENGSRG